MLSENLKSEFQSVNNSIACDTMAENRVMTQWQTPLLECLCTDVGITTYPSKFLGHKVWKSFALVKKYGILVINKHLTHWVREQKQKGYNRVKGSNSVSVSGRSPLITWKRRENSKWLKKKNILTCVTENLGVWYRT